MPTRSRARNSDFFGLVPDRDREHPAQVLQAIDAVFVVEMDDRLGVRMGVKPVAALLEVLTQLAVIVDLAVENDPLRTVLVMHRLLARGEIDDRQPPHREPDILMQVKTVVVRPAVNDRSIHRPEHLAVRRPPTHYLQIRRSRTCLELFLPLGTQSRLEHFSPLPSREYRVLTLFLDQHQPTAMNINKKTCICVRWRYAVPTFP